MDAINPQSTSGRDDGITLHGYLVWLIGLCVLPMVVLAAYLSYVQVKAGYAEQERDASVLLHNLTQLIDNKIESRITTLQTLSTSPNLDSEQSYAAFYEEARRASASIGGNFALADLSMQMLISTNTPLGTLLPRLPHPKGFAAAPAVIATGKPAVGDSFLGPIAKVPLIALVVPVLRDDDDAVTALLLNTVETSRFQEYLNGASIPESWIATITDSTGTIIARRGPPQDENAVPENRLQFASAVMHSKWSLLLEVPKGAYRSVVVTSVVGVIASLVLAVILSVAGGRLAARRLERAVGTLADPDRDLAQGEILRIAEVEAIRERLAQGLASLRANEIRYRELFQSNPHPMWVYDLETLAFLAVNDAAIAHYGYTREELLGMTIKDIRPAEDVPRLLENIAKVTEGHNRAGVWQHRRKDGSIILVEIESHTLLFDGRRAKVILAHDVTESVRARETLEEEEEKFRVLAEQSLVGIFILDGDRIAYTNARAAEIFGYQRGALTGHSVLEIPVDEDKPRIAEDVRRLLSGEADSLSEEVRAIQRDGTEIIVGTQGRRTRIGGKTVIIGTLQDITEKKRAADTIRDYISRLERSMLATVDAVSTMVEMRDPYTAGHERRVGEMAAAIAAEMGLDENMQQGLRVAGGVHDIGKIAVPAEILARPRSLTEIEYNMVKTHAQQGYEILKGIDFPWPVAEVARQHHERFDGTGYPRGLKGEEILHEARILAVADVVESMASHRPYRAGLGIDVALQEIEQGQGSIYDPNAAEACLRLFREKGYQLPA